MECGGYDKAERKHNFFRGDGDCGVGHVGWLVGRI